ncbi:MAG: hypothetical protein AAB601_03490, partial [Patescibacteria group bacterium]
MPNGNVGIGTAAPVEKLTVVGNVSATSFVGALSGGISAANVSSDVFGRLQGNGNFAFPASLGVATSSQSGLPQALSVYGNAYVSGLLGVGTASPSYTIDVNVPGATMRLGNTNGATLYLHTTGNYISIGANQFNFTTTQPQGFTFMGGNVGIGIANPGVKLDIANAGPVSLGLYNTTAGGRHTISYDVGNNFVFYNAGGGSRYSFDGSGATGYLTILSGSGWGASTGNVGIGTIAPNYRLDVSGQANASAGLCIAGDCKTAWSQVGGQWTASGNNIYNANSGNVGIGTTGPGAKLEVTRAASVSTAFDEVLRVTQTNGVNGGAGPGIFFYGGTNNQAFAAIGGWNVSDGVGVQDAKLRFRTASGGTLADRIVIDNLGNVGIGTTNPGA